MRGLAISHSGVRGRLCRGPLAATTKTSTAYCTIVPSLRLRPYKALQYRWFIWRTLGGRGVNSYKRGGGTRKKPHRTYIHRRGNKRGTVLIPTPTRTRLPKTSSEICAVSEKYRMHSHGCHRNQSKFKICEHYDGRSSADCRSVLTIQSSLFMYGHI